MRIKWIMGLVSGIAVLTAGNSFAAPRGFEALGKSLPEDAEWITWTDKEIKKRELTEGESSVLTFPFIDVEGDGPAGQVAIADLNNDGRNDLMTGGGQIFYQREDGTFSKTADLRISMAAGGGFAIADLNGDRKNDVVCGDSSTPQGLLYVFFQEEGGNLKPMQPISIGSCIDAVATGDLNGDGYSDIVTCNSKDNTLSIFFQKRGEKESFSFKERLTLKTGKGPFRVITGDLNSDGKNDIIVTHQELEQNKEWSAPGRGKTSSIYYQKEKGQFSTEPDLILKDSDDGAYPDVAIGDLNGDGKNDIAITRYTEAGRFNLFIYHQKGDHAFPSIPDESKRVLGYASSVVIADLDADGYKDLAINTYSPGNVLIFFQRKGVLLPDPDRNLPMGKAGGGWRTQTIAVGDLNSDGKNDIAASIHRPDNHPEPGPQRVRIFYQKTGAALEKIKEKLPEIGKEAKERGYLAFSRNYLDPIYPYTKPKKDEITDELFVFASLDEYEPISFGIYALEEIKGLKVEVTDLINKDGKGSINKENIDIRVVRLLRFLKGPEAAPLCYAWQPSVLEKKETVDIPVGSVKQFWLTVKVPLETRPGYYEATINLKPENRKPSSLKLYLRVLPIRLKEPDILQAMIFAPDIQMGWYPETAEKQLIDMAEHGMNSMHIYPDAPLEIKKEGGDENKYFWDFSKFSKTTRGPGGQSRWNRWDTSKWDTTEGYSLERMVQLYQKTGFTRTWFCDTPGVMRRVIGVTPPYYKPFTKDYDAAFVAGVKQLLQKAKEKNWPPFSLSVFDEGATHPEAKYYFTLLKKEFPEVKTHATLNGMWVNNNDGQAADAYIDVRLYNFVNEQVIRETKEAGDEFCVYNVGACPGGGRQGQAQNRFARGLYLWKIGAKGFTQWHYAFPGTYSFIHPSPNGPIPTMDWEAVREGVDDGKYIFTLNTMIEKAKKSKKPELIKQAKEAEDVLEEIKNKIPVDIRKVPEFIEATSLKSYDVFRWKIAEQILKLQELEEQ